jgi:hypothetical protein
MPNPYLARPIDRPAPVPLDPSAGLAALGRAKTLAVPDGARRGGGRAPSFAATYLLMGAGPHRSPSAGFRCAVAVRR